MSEDTTTRGPETDPGDGPSQEDESRSRHARDAAASGSASGDESGTAAAPVADGAVAPSTVEAGDHGDGLSGPPWPFDPAALADGTGDAPAILDPAYFNILGSEAEMLAAIIPGAGGVGPGNTGASFSPFAPGHLPDGIAHSGPQTPAASLFSFASPSVDLAPHMLFALDTGGLGSPPAHEGTGPADSPGLGGPGGEGGNDTGSGGPGGDGIDDGPQGLAIHGGPGDDVLSGGAGDDTIRDGGGDDSLSGGLGHDVLYGNGGDDTIDGGGGDDSASGGSGDDVVSGGAGDDTLSGNGGDDVVSGGAGDDSLSGGSGDDTLLGDAGNDAVHGGGGHDSIGSGSGDDTVWGDAGNDTIDGGGGGDLVSGGGGRDVLFGGHGDDALDGGKGDDELFGESGNDTLIGGAGKDTLSGGPGSDTLTGGSGKDTFALSGNHVGTDVDHITDFHLGKGGDVLDLTGVLHMQGGDALSDFVQTWNDGTDTHVDVSPNGNGAWSEIAALDNTVADLNALIADHQIVAA